MSSTSPCTVTASCATIGNGTRLRIPMRAMNNQRCMMRYSFLPDVTAFLLCRDTLYPRFADGETGPSDDGDNGAFHLPSASQRTYAATASSCSVETNR